MHRWVTHVGERWRKVQAVPRKRLEAVEAAHALSVGSILALYVLPYIGNAKLSYPAGYCGTTTELRYTAGAVTDVVVPAGRVNLPIPP